MSLLSRLSLRRRPYLFGPILVRELRAAARRRRTFILRTAYLAIMTIILAVFWQEQRGRSYYGPGSGDPGIDAIVQQHYESSRLGREFALTALITQLIMLALVCPILTCASISGERASKTLGTLMTTDLSVREIIMGKLASRSWAIVLLIGLSLPVLLTARIMGGVSVREIVGLLLMTLTCSLFLASLGLLLSVLTARSLAAALQAYAIIALLYMGIPFIWAILSIGGPTPKIPPWVMFLHPIVTSVAILVEPVMAGGAQLPLPPWLLCSLAHLAAMLLVTVLAIVLLRRLVQRELEGRSGPTRAATRRTAPQDPAGAQTPQARPASATSRRKVRSAKPIRGNPVLWQELRTIKARRKPVRSIIMFTILALGFGWVGFKLLFDADRYERQPIAFSVIFVMWAWVYLAAAAASATSIAGEKDRNTWLPTLTTIMTPGQILRGKFWGVWRRLIIPILVLVGFHVFLILAGMIHPQVLLHVGMTLAGPVLLFVVLGMFFSMRCQRSTTAGVVHLVTVIGMNVVPLFLIVLAEIADLVSDEEMFLAACPMAWPISATAGAWRSSGRTYWLFHGGMVDFEAFTVGFFVFGLVLLFISGTLWFWMIAAFDRMNDRIPKKHPARGRLASGSAA